MKKKILVVTLTLGHNYGGILQAYALQRVINSLGYDVTTTGSPGSSLRRAVRTLPMVKKVMKKLRKADSDHVPFAITAQNTAGFLRRNMEVGKFDRVRFLALFGEYDAIVTGSDQVWRKAYVHLPHTFLGFPSPKASKLSYAASFGKDDIDDYGAFDRYMAKRQLQKYRAVSVREVSGVSLIEGQWGISAKTHVDPTLLLLKEEYLELIRGEKSQLRGMFFYCLDSSPAKHKIKEGLAQELGLTPYALIDGDRNNGKPLPPVEEWLASFRDANFVLTDSFHGVVFSIIFRKPFVVIGNPARGLARFESLLQILGLADRLINVDSSGAEEEAVKVSHKVINWNVVSAEVENKRKEAIEYLSQQLP